jgi:hypothetical protein
MGAPIAAQRYAELVVAGRRHAKRAAERLSYPALMLVVRALKREVRAIRGCLGAYRR